MNINKAACSSISRSVRETHRDTHIAKDKHAQKDRVGRSERQQHIEEGEREKHWIRKAEEMSAARNGKS